jgi:hypothetical protein
MYFGLVVVQTNFGEKTNLELLLQSLVIARRVQ